jgi:hypothetical protein
MKNRIQLIATLVLVFSVLAHADGETKVDSSVTIDDLKGRLELSVPETPAFTALGITPETVITPGNAHDLALAILDGVDKEGNLQTGIALELSPFAAAGSDLSLNEYQNNDWKRFLYRSRISFATSNGKSDEDKATRHAIGFRFTPYSDADPRMNADINNCIVDAFKAHADANQPPIPGSAGVDLTGGAKLSAEAKPGNAELMKKSSACISDKSAALWNKTAWDVGIVAYDADDDKLKESGYAVWTSVSFGFGKNDKFILHAKHFNDMLSPDVNEDSVMDIQDGNVFSFRVLYKVDKLHLMAESSRVDVDYPLLDRDDDYTDMMVGAEIPIFNKIYIQLAYGKRSGSSIPVTNDNYLSAQIRWALSENSLFGGNE